ncbi:MAG: GNAT family N-acetyltransferase [Anaerococcus sp.]|nr:GNAT family N-acetyltransferase [Anaerococcus sp.]
MNNLEKSSNKINFRRVKIYNIKRLWNVSRILNLCGKDMAKKYNLHHWDNIMVKTIIIVIIGIFKNRVYIGEVENKPIATFQIKELENILFFEKLGVLPNLNGKGYGSLCMRFIEKNAQMLGKKIIKMEVYKLSKHAIAFYESLGFSIDNEIDTLKHKNVIMKKEIWDL